MTNELIKLDETNIEDKIYTIRGVQVMLDSDLAGLYDVETKRINEAVRRNKYKFPERFTWILDDNEVNNLWSQNATANISTMSRNNPRVFTEQGIYMLATILKSKIASEVTLNIMDTFVFMRKIINTDSIKNKMLVNHENRILKLEETFNKLSQNEQINVIYFEGQIYDAYSKILDIFKFAKEELIIIDSYADKSVLDMISKLKVKVIIITKDSERLNNLDVAKYDEQYNNLKVIRNNTFHDRYFIIDNKEIYHSGSSINNAGNKTFSINKIEDDFVIETLLQKIGQLVYIN